MEEKVKEVMNEAREKERRKLNVILVNHLNVPESEGENAEERKKRELEQVKNITGKIAEVGRGDFWDPIRLGVKTIGQESKPKILRVTVKNEDVKKECWRMQENLMRGIKIKAV